MLKQMFLLSTALLITATGYTQEKKSLTLEQVAKAMPAGINSHKSTIIDWRDGANIILRDGANYSTYNIKSGEKESYTLPEPKVQPSLINAMRKHVSNPTFSPDSTMMAYTKGNDLYIMDVQSRNERAMSHGGTDLILNGWSSWVYYEEILGRSTNYKAFWWSPDSKKIAYYKFDDTNVPMFPIYDAAGQHGKLTETRYPKAGDENPKVEIAMVDIASGKTTWADFNRDDDQYFGIPFWSAESDKFMVPWMPREQNNLVLYEVSPIDGDKTALYNENQKTWIDWIGDMVFGEEGFYMTRDFDGWEQIYYQPFNGDSVEQLTTNKNWNTQILKLDEKKGLLLFSSRADISTRNDVYMLNLKKGTTQKISTGDYNYTNIKISPSNKHFTADISNVSTHTKAVLVNIGKEPIITAISDSKGAEYDNYKIAKAQMRFIEVDGYKLPASIILPIDMDSTKQYPVIISMYGGPNAGSVMDRWNTPSVYNQLWANQEVIQISIDHRASGHCGKEGLNFIHRSLGQIELSDYIEWVKYLRTLPYVDATKIGITGFSYGGTMTMLALTDGADYFQFGIAGGGVMDWQLYDTHYTERYMDRPQDNKEGYDFTRVWNRVDKYKGGDNANSMVRITHGSLDDNVHMQNTMQLVYALQMKNKEFELMIYPGAYHGYGGEQRVHSRKSDLTFWYKHLLGKKLPALFN